MLPNHIPAWRSEFYQTYHLNPIFKLNFWLNHWSKVIISHYKIWFQCLAENEFGSASVQACDFYLLFQLRWLSCFSSPGHLFMFRDLDTSTSDTAISTGSSMNISCISRAASTTSLSPSTPSSITSWAPSTGWPSSQWSVALPQDLTPSSCAPPRRSTTTWGRGWGWWGWWGRWAGPGPAPWTTTAGPGLILWNFQQDTFNKF